MFRTPWFRRSVALLGFALAVGWSPAARAQDDDFGVGGEGEDAELPGEISDPVEDQQPAPPPVDNLANWPVEMLLRQRTLPSSSWSVGAFIGFADSGDTVPFRLEGGYGFSNDLTVLASYQLFLVQTTIDATGEEEKGIEGAGPLGVGALYAVHRTPRELEVDVGGELVIELGDGAPSMVYAGANLWYVISDFGLGMPARQLAITLESSSADEGSVRPIFVQLPIVAGYQATSSVFVGLETNLGRFNISDSSTKLIGSDAIGVPVKLSGYFSPSNKLDFGAEVALNLKTPEGVSVGDTFVVIIGARYYGLSQ